jgi:hypothetical protein
MNLHKLLHAEPQALFWDISEQTVQQNRLHHVTPENDGLTLRKMATQ